MEELVLGEFRVEEPLAKGGMGQVWLARHEAQGLPVAIKVMSAELAELPMWRERFRTEVRAMAQLEHPGVVWVFDYGEVPDEVAAASEDTLPARAPWVAMELASAGTLDSRIGALRWSGVRALLLSLLDTLAHAHARKVIHRDIKPANVLLCGPDDLRPGPKLTDFGIAASLDDDTTSGDRMLGTPAYMAPEQILGLRADLGAWTDLYALGCLTWELVCGAPPFEGEDRSQVLWAHLQAPLPDLSPRIAVPAELGGWLETLLAKSPDRRFARAADAAHALRALSDVPEEEPEDPTLVTLLRATARSTLPLTRSSSRRTSQPPPRATWFDDTTLTEASLEFDVGLTSSADWPLPGCPLDWRRPIPVRRSRKLQGAGLALVGLRAVPLAGRDEERDALWNVLVGVHATQRARAVVIRGPAGTGKTRLARWLGERAEEVGTATWLLARHVPGQAAGEGVAAALRHALRSNDRGPGQRKARLTEVLGELVGDAVCGWLHPEDEPERTLASKGERQAMVGAVLDVLAQERTVVLHLDDVHSADDAIQLADYLLQRQRVSPSAVLIVLTVQEEALAEEPRVEARLDALCGNPDVSTVRLGALEGAQRIALLDGLLDLDGETAEQLLARTGGNPLFAVQLVGEWAARGLLQAGRRGFQLRPEVETGPGDSLGAIWAPRIERVLEDLPADAGVWLERLALAGEDLEEAEAASLGEGLDLGVDPAGMMFLVLDRLCEARLGTRSEGRFAFVHGLVRDALSARAARDGRLAEHHGLLADRILARPDADPIAVGRHLLRAGRAAEAVDRIVEALPAHRRRYGDRASLAACELATTAMRADGRPPGDVGWGRIDLARVHALKGTGDDAAAAELVDRLIEAAEAHGWPPEIRLGAWLERAIRLVWAGDLEGAEARLAEIASDPGIHDEVLAKVHYWRYAMGELGNDLERSRVFGLKACEVLERMGDPASRDQAATIRGVLGFMLADIDEAEPWVLEAVARAERSNSVIARARAYHNLGKVHWYRGRWTEAEEALERSEELYLQSGSVSLGNPRLMRIQVRLVQRAWTDALHLCQDLVDKLAGEGQSVSLRLLELVALAGLGEWQEFDPRFEAVQEGLRRRGWCNGEDATALEQLGQLALDDGQLDRARRAWEEALDHWSRHDRREHEEAKLRRWLDGLPD